MKVDVRFFASLREAVGRPHMAVTLADGAGFDALMQALDAELPPTALLALRAENVRLARNQALVNVPFELSEGDEVAFLPPVTGG